MSSLVTISIQIGARLASEKGILLSTVWKTSCSSLRFSSNVSFLCILSFPTSPGQVSSLLPVLSQYFVCASIITFITQEAYIPASSYKKCMFLNSRNCTLFISGSINGTGKKCVCCSNIIKKIPLLIVRLTGMTLMVSSGSKFLC